MLWTTKIIAFVLVTYVAGLHVSARSASYNRYQEPFEVPGEIVYDLTVAEVLEAVGAAWQAGTLAEAFRTACTSLSPKLYNTYADTAVHGLCDPIINSQIEEGCSDIWREISYRDQPVISLIPGLTSICHVSDYYNGHGSYEWHYINNYTGYYTNYGNDNDWYPAVVEAEQEGMNFILGIYDVCSQTGEGIKKINNIILAVADVFGPSTFNSVFNREIEPYSICRALRNVLGMSTTEYIHTELNILKYPAADGLEFLQSFDICSAGSYSKELDILKDLLVLFSDMNEYTFCAYISQNHTREEYLAQGTTILNNFYSIVTDTQICSDVLSIVVPLDTTGIIYLITSYNMEIPSERNALCTVIVNAFSMSSSYEPIPYVLPPGVNFDPQSSFSNPGEILPNLHFTDLLDIYGAVYRAPTIIAGLHVYCTVFESFLLEYIPVDVFDLAGLCGDLERGDTSALENDCLEYTVPNIYGSDYPISLRPINPNSVMVYTVTELLQLHDISETEVCQSLDQFINSPNISVQYLVDFVMDIALAEIVPSIPGFCQDFDDIICYFHPSCPDYYDPFANYTIYYYRSSLEQRVSDFEDGVVMLESLILSFLGFEDRETLCHLIITNGIDPVTGRATEDVVVQLKSQIIALLTDFDRCQSLVDTIFQTVPERFYSFFIRNDSNKNLLYKVTGYETPEQFCEASTRFFGEAEEPIGTDTLVAHVNLFVQVAIYLRELVPSYTT